MLLGLAQIVLGPWGLEFRVLGMSGLNGLQDLQGSGVLASFFFGRRGLGRQSLRAFKFSECRDPGYSI